MKLVRIRIELVSRQAVRTLMPSRSMRAMCSSPPMPLPVRYRPRRWPARLTLATVCTAFLPCRRDSAAQSVAGVRRAG